MMSGNDDDKVEKPNDYEIPGSQLGAEVDTEPVLHLSEDTEAQNTCETYMSQQSDSEEECEAQEVTKDESVHLEDSNVVNSSLEVEVNISDQNMSALIAEEEKLHLGLGQESLQEVSEVTKLDGSTSIEEPTKKRKERFSSSFPSPKKSRHDSPSRISLETTREESQMKQEEEQPVLEISSSTEKTIILDDSQEFSLRIEDTSPPTHLTSDKASNEDSPSWKSHSKDKNASPNLNSLSQKSGSSWSSHTNIDPSLSWSSHKSIEDKDTVLKKENDSLIKESEHFSNTSPPENAKTKDINAGSDSSEGITTYERTHPALVTIHWVFDEKANKVLSAEVKQLSILEETHGEKPGRMSITSSTSFKSSSSTGSVGLPGPFPLPGHNRFSIMSSVSSSTSSSSGTRPGWDGPFLKPQVPGAKTVVPLTCGHCSNVFPPAERISSPLLNGSPKLEEEEELHVKQVSPRRPRKSFPSSSIKEDTTSTESQPQAASTPTPNKSRGRPKKNNGTNFNKIPKNGVAKPVKTKAQTPTPHRTPTKEHGRGEPVLARWGGDGRYYPGWISQAPGASNQVLVRFCDGQAKLTPASKVVRADIVTAGSLILSATDTDEYEEALVVQVDMTGAEPQYQIERENVTKEVQFSNIALLDSQVTELTMTDVQKAASIINFNDLSLDNIMTHPRKRSMRTSFAEMARGSPPPSGRKKKRQLTPEPSTSHGKTFSGPEDYYVDTDSSTQSTCSVDLRGKEVKPLDIECSPPELNKGSRLKLNHYRRNMTTKSKKREGKPEPESMVKVLGPIPEPGSQLFAGCVFLITYTDQVQLQKLAYAKSAASEPNAECVPVKKERLRTQIKCGGGKVYNNLSQVTKDDHNTYLITDKPCNTPLYLQCLVNKIPIYSTSVIVQCCTENKPFKELIALRSTKKLPAGYSIAKECFVNPRSSQPLQGKTILLALSGEPSLTTFWENIVKKMGGVSHIYHGNCLVGQKLDVIVTDPDCDQDLVAQACEQNVPLVSLTWLQQCIINGDYRSYTEHSLYKYNSITGVDSPEY